MSEIEDLKEMIRIQGEQIKQLLAAPKPEAPAPRPQAPPRTNEAGGAMAPEGMKIVARIDSVQQGMGSRAANPAQMKVVVETMQKEHDLMWGGGQGMTAPDARIMNPRVPRGPEYKDKKIKPIGHSND